MENGEMRILTAVIPEGQALRRSGWAVWNLLITAEGFERGFTTEKAEKAEVFKRDFTTEKAEKAEDFMGVLTTEKAEKAENTGEKVPRGLVHAMIYPYPTDTIFYGFHIKIYQ
mgnify:CR=1 FL=1